MGAQITPSAPQLLRHKTLTLIAFLPLSLSFIPNSIDYGASLLFGGDGDRLERRSVFLRRCPHGGAAEASVPGVEAARDVRWTGPVSQDTGPSEPVLAVEEELDGDLYADF